MKPRLTRIAPELPASDLQSSIEYFEQKLGFQLVLTTPDGEYAIVERDQVSIHLFQDHSRHLSPVGVHIFTPDIEQLHAEFEQRSARISQKILRKPWGNRDFRVKDNSGNEIKFTEPISAEE